MTGVPVIYWCITNYPKTEWHKATTTFLCSQILCVRNSDKAQWICLIPPLAKIIQIAGVTRTAVGQSYLEASSLTRQGRGWHDLKCYLSQDCCLGTLHMASPCALGFHVAQQLQGTQTSYTEDQHSKMVPANPVEAI